MIINLLTMMLYDNDNTVTNNYNVTDNDDDDDDDYENSNDSYWVICYFTIISNITH